MLVSATSWIPIGIGYGFLGIQLVSSTTGIGYLNQIFTVPTDIHLVSEIINVTRNFWGGIPACNNGKMICLLTALCTQDTPPPHEHHNG
jgi:hypothetical protein